MCVHVVIYSSMGGLESKFNGLLVDGRGEEAELMWSDNLELQNHYRPNAQIKSSPTRDTPLHCTARHEMEVGVACCHDTGSLLSAQFMYI